jgi:hypothetical protein
MTDPTGGAPDMSSDQPTGSSDLASLVSLPLELLENILKVLHHKYHSKDCFLIIHPHWIPQSTFIKGDFMSLEQMESLPVNRFEFWILLMHRKFSWIKETTKEVQSGLHRYEQATKEKMTKWRATMHRPDVDSTREDELRTRVHDKERRLRNTLHHGENNP